VEKLTLINITCSPIGSFVALQQSAAEEFGTLSQRRSQQYAINTPAYFYINY
jgi:hypothetical protein